MTERRKQHNLLTSLIMAFFLDFFQFPTPQHFLAYAILHAQNKINVTPCLQGGANTSQGQGIRILAGRRTLLVRGNAE